MPKKECQYCHKDIDKRGHRMHELTCDQNPNKGSNHLDSNRVAENLSSMMDIYRQGIRDGIDIGKKAA